MFRMANDRCAPNCQTWAVWRGTLIFHVEIFNARLSQKNLSFNFSFSKSTVFSTNLLVLFWREMAHFHFSITNKCYTKIQLYLLYPLGFSMSSVILAMHTCGHVNHVAKLESWLQVQNGQHHHTHTHVKTSKIFESSFTTLPLLLFRAMNANVDKIINDFFYAFLFFSILGKVGR